MYHMGQSEAMARTDEVTLSPRQRLLDPAVDHVAEHGLSDTSLRQLAAALGTSHRMLIYHFGSKEQLVVEIIRELESRQRATFGAISADEEAGSGDVIRRMWRQLSAPRNEAHQ